MRVACLVSVALIAAVAACGEVASPIDATSIDTAPPIDAIDAPATGVLTLTKTGAGGTVASLPTGIDCGTTCQAAFPLGTSVTLTATLDVGVQVVAWGGACAGSTGTTCTVTINSDTAASIQFGPSVHTITLTTGGAGVGTVTSSPAGLACGGGMTACTATYPYGTSLTLTATPQAGSLFAGWSGGTCSGIGPCTFTVRNDASANADFALDNFTLIVSKVGNGTGTVTSSPAGINCGATCASAYTAGAMVTLTAAPAADSVFTGWTGACTGTGTCTVQMTTSRMVTATFTLRQFTLSVMKTGTGTGTVTSTPAGINCGATCSAAYDSGTMVTLTAAPAAGSTFAGWSGAGCSGTGACVVTVTAAASVSAAFNLTTFALTVTRAGTGTGTVTSSPAGINCGATCSASYASGTTVTLTAAPAAGSTFAGWTGACTGTGTCVVTINAATNVTANFNATMITITVAKTGTNAAAATVTSSPAGITCGATCTGSFAPGTVVTLTATPGGSVFSAWSGAGCSGNGTCVFTVSSAVTVTASFRQLRVALEASAMSCLRAATNSMVRTQSLLQARGHAVTFVAGTDIDTAAEINAYDVVVLPGPGAGSCVMQDFPTYDPVVAAYVNTQGGGVVGSGWFLYSNFMAPNLVAVMPSPQISNYLSGAQTVTMVAGSPITAGLAGFTTQEWLPWGGGPRAGTTPLLNVGTTTVAESWSVGAGRGVYVGPMFVEDYTAYNNESLLDGSQASSVEFWLRAIEWAGKAR